MTVCWVDLGAGDPASAAAFYSQLLNWTVAAPDESGYRLASLRGHLVAALGPAEDPGIPYWTVYVRTADITNTVNAVVAAGGSIVVPPTPAGDAGVSAVIRDPYGGPLSLWQPGTHLGTYTSGEHGTLAGIQLGIAEPADQRAFLHAAFDWQVQSNGTITNRGRTVATWVPGPGSNRPSPWLVTFFVADRTAAIERALRLGASRCADRPDVLIDPAGAAFAISSTT